MENQAITQKPHTESGAPFEAQRYQITGGELNAVLKTYGLTQKEFGKHIGKSRVTVCRMIAESNKIKLRFAQILEKVVGIEIYTMVITQYRERQARRMEHAIKSKELQMEAERLRKEKREEQRQRKLGMTQSASNQGKKQPKSL